MFNMAGDVKWEIKEFDNLSLHELYAILRLRNEVFVVEQNCVFQDADNKDPGSRHMMGWKMNELVAYSRIVPPAPPQNLVTIGRVVVAHSARGSGLGKELMKLSIEQVSLIFGKVPIRIGAQVYLKEFYSSIGFRQSGDVYLEDGLEHMEMIRPI